MKSILFPIILSFVVFGCSPEQNHETSTADHIDDGHVHEADGGVSAVHFPVSCDKAVAEDFNAAVAAMHNMTYNVARGQFEAILEQDPDCGMANWGVGMTYIHPLWSDSPAEEQMIDGSERVAAARKTDLTDKESAYIDALAAYYDNPEMELYGRLKLLAAGIEKIHETYPDDLEAKALFAVTHLSTAAPGSVDMEVIDRASTAAFEVLIEEPDHPHSLLCRRISSRGSECGVSQSS